MTQPQETVKTVAPLANVSLLMAAMKRAVSSPTKERLLVLHGHAGYGKTTAAGYAANKLRGYRVECCSHWSRKALLAAILFEMGIPAGHSIAAMFDQVVEQLAKSGRPLIIDEADHLVRNSCIELVRDIHDKSESVVLLCGEEGLPKKLERWARVHSRVLEFVPAQPADRDDVAHLARLYCPGVEIATDWLDELHRQTGGNTRRVCVNLTRARFEAEHLPEISLESWGERGWYTGSSPHPRRAV
jgi:DNA transposition AAA+ family ATPase